jgi:glycosyltransferase involved in cell wall biosynthesis
MIANHTVTLVLPCYNEEAGVRRVIETTPKAIDQIVVVDNNCTDRTADVARSLGAAVVRQPIRGYGAAYKAGFAAATGDILVTMDADGTYPVEWIVPLVEHLLAAQVSFISGTRFPLDHGSTMPVTNRIGNMVLSWTAAVLFFKHIRDSQSGMWVFRRSLLEKLRLESDGMSFSEEIKLEALRRRDVRFLEMHIPYHERVGEAKLLKWRDGTRNLLYLFRLRLRAVR